MKNLYLIYCFLFLSIAPLSSQKTDLNQLSLNRLPAALTELKSFLAIPNDAVNAEDIDNNILWLTGAFQKRKFITEVLQTAGTPLFYAERRFKNADRTILFYMHFDGQPVDPSEWDQPDPYNAVLKARKGGKFEEISWDTINGAVDPEWRIFGRSSSDDKGPIVMLLAAIDILDNDLSGTSKTNIKIILDGEEEKSSPQLSAVVPKYKNKLASDIMIINDGPVHLSGKPTLIFGCRGLQEVTITVFGPRTQQHSGHYGNYAPNPAFALAELLASMKDEEGQVLIPGFYDDIIFTAEDLRVMRNVPETEEMINKTIGIAEPEKVGRFYQESLQYPSLNVRGMQSGYIGEQARTIVPEKAVASFDIRLVPESDPVRLTRLLKAHIIQEGYYVIDRDPTEKERLTQARIVKFQTGGLTMPFRTEINSGSGVWLNKVLKDTFGDDPVIIRIMGGSVPIAPFINELKVPSVIVPMVNSDNNQHGPNENLRIGNFVYGIKVFLALMIN